MCSGANMASNSTGERSGTFILIGIIGLALYSCSADSDREQLAEEFGIDEEVAEQYLDNAGGDYDAAVTAYNTDVESLELGEGVTARGDFDEDEARHEAEEELAGSPYDYSYGCTIDCSGHQAGWDYRAETGYDTGIGNYGKSQSFDEGARAYEEAVDERVEEMQEEYQNGEEPY